MTAADLTAIALHRHSEPPKLIKSVRGDLDWIVMKCLEKERHRRYETANGVAADQSLPASETGPPKQGRLRSCRSSGGGPRFWPRSFHLVVLRRASSAAAGRAAGASSPGASRARQRAGGHCPGGESLPNGGRAAPGRPPSPRLRGVYTESEFDCARGRGARG